MMLLITFRDFPTYRIQHKDDELIRIFSRESIKNVDWVKSLWQGTEFQLYALSGCSQAPGAESMKKYLGKGKGKGMALLRETPGICLFAP
jgi:hypothetical protein